MARPRKIDDDVVLALVKGKFRPRAIALALGVTVGAVRAAIRRARGAPAATVARVRVALVPWRTPSGHYAPCTAPAEPCVCEALRSALGEA